LRKIHRIRVSVFGLGYVGTVSAACLANEGFEVIGVDTDEQKISTIQEGRSPIQEKGLDVLVKKAVSTGHLHATTNAEEAVVNSDISLICVGTPSNEDGSLNLSYVFKVASEIAHCLKHKNDFHTLVIRSTVLPGTTEQCMHIVEKISGKRVNNDFAMVVNPEFLREGSAVADYYSPPYTIIGATHDTAADITASLYKSIEAPLFKTDIKVAELIKYACNAFHALKVSFANEIGAICKSLGIDSHEVMDIFCQDTKLNLSPYYLKPGFAFGGSCLPKDTRALVRKAEELKLDIPLLKSIIPSNDAHIARTLELIKATGKSKVALLGISFKGGTDDLRESPLVILAQRLLEAGYELQVYDPDVSPNKSCGSNKKFIEEAIPTLPSLISSNPAKVIQGADIVVIGKRLAEVLEELVTLVKTTRKDLIIIDLVRIQENLKNLRWLDERYQGICW